MSYNSYVSKLNKEKPRIQFIEDGFLVNTYAIKALGLENKEEIAVTMDTTWNERSIRASFITMGLYLSEDIFPDPSKCIGDKVSQYMKLVPVYSQVCYHAGWITPIKALPFLKIPKFASKNGTLQYYKLIGNLDNFYEYMYKKECINKGGNYYKFKSVYKVRKTGKPVIYFDNYNGEPY